jgi:hypothetical protein
MNTKNISSYFRKLNLSGADGFNFQSTNISIPKSTKLQELMRNKAALLIGVIILISAAFLLGRMLPGGDSRVSAPAPAATQSLNKEFKFPIRDDKGNRVSDVNYLIQSVNLQDSFIYQGKLAEAVKGRTFMIVNLKITNPYSKSIQINARDYIRVRVNGTSEQLAPEIHNDPVQVDAKATKYTRIGLPINDTDKDIELLVGEINGSKTTIKLSLAR